MCGVSGLIPDISCFSKDLASKSILWLQSPRKHEKLLNVFNFLTNREPTQQLQCRETIIFCDKPEKYQIPRPKFTADKSGINQTKIRYKSKKYLDFSLI